MKKAHFLIALVLLASACAGNVPRPNDLVTQTEAMADLKDTVQIRHTINLSAVEPSVGLPDVWVASAQGSGFIVHSAIHPAYSIVATAQHVCIHEDPVEIPKEVQGLVAFKHTYDIKRLDGRSFTAKIVYEDAKIDVCLLRVEELIGVPVHFTNPPPLGTQVISTGAPKGVWGVDRGVINDGRYCGVRQPEEDAEYEYPLLTLSGVSGGGASGGPAWYRGRVFGLVRATRTEHGYIVFAVPSYEVQKAVAKYLKTK